MANNTTALFNQGFPHYLVSDIILYIVSGSVLLANAGILSMFLVQRWRRPSKTQLSPAGVLVINLLASDALVGAMGIFITATFGASATSSRYGCINRVTPRFFFRMGSHMAIINVAVDRYIAVIHTLHYRELMTLHRSVVLVGVGWAVPLLGTAFAYLANDWRPGATFCYELPSFNAFLTYVRLPSHTVALFTVVFILFRVFFFLRNHEKNESPQYLRKYSQKSARLLLYVTTTYVVCWLPFDILLLLVLFLRRPYFKLVLDATVILAYCSFLVNTFIFSYKTENIRKPVTDLLRDVSEAVGGKKAVSAEIAKPANRVTAGVRTTSMHSSSSNLTRSSVVSHNGHPGDAAVHI